MHRRGRHEPVERLPHQLVGTPPGQPLDRVREVDEARLLVGREHDVGRVVDEEPVALLGRPQLELQALALADVAGDAPDRDQLALVVDLPDDADLERDLVPVLVPEQQPVRRRPARIGGDLGQPLGRLREGLDVDELGERVPDELARQPADDVLGPVRVERVDPVAVHLEDQVGRRLDERAVPLLGLVDDPLEALALADVADRALGALELAVLEDPDGGQLGREGAAVLATNDETEAQGAAPGIVEVGPRLQRRAHRLLGDDRREVHAGHLGGRPAEQVLGRVGEEREPAVGVVAPDHVRRRLHEAAVVGLGRLDPLEEVRVRQGDGGVVGEGLEGREAVGGDRARLGVADGEGADDVAAGRAERRGGHRAEAHAIRDVEVVLLPWDARIGRVARRPDDAPLARREAVDPAVDRELLDPQPLAGLLVRAAGEDHRAQVRPVLRHPREVGAVRREDAPRLLDDQPEDRVRVADGRHARRDLAQGPLGLGAPGDLLARPAELADQLRVVDGDRREVRERREQRRLLVAEAPDLGREHRERAQDHGLADERREGDRPDAGALEELAVGRAVGEPVVGGVLVGDDDPPLADREVDARARRRRAPATPPASRRRCPRRAPSGPRRSPGPAGRSPRPTTRAGGPPRRRRPGAAPPGPGSSSGAARSRAAPVRRRPSARGRPGWSRGGPRGARWRARRRPGAASASSRRSASSPKASRSRWPAWNTPTRPSSPTTGAVITECRPTSCTPSSPSG